jgi:hypothetical protein
LQVRDENLDLTFIHTGSFLLSDSSTVIPAAEIVQPIVSIYDLGEAYVCCAYRAAIKKASTEALAFCCIAQMGWFKP